MPRVHCSDHLGIGPAWHRTPEPPFPSLLVGKGRRLEVVCLDAQIRRNVVTDHFEPVDLFGGEAAHRALTLTDLLLYQPCVEVGIHLFGEGNQLIILMDGEADEGYEVGENTFAACTFDLGLL